MVPLFHNWVEAFASSKYTFNILAPTIYKQIIYARTIRTIVDIISIFWQTACLLIRFLTARKTIFTEPYLSSPDGRFRCQFFEVTPAYTYIMQNVCRHFRIVHSFSKLSVEIDRLEYWKWASCSNQTSRALKRQPHKGHTVSTSTYVALKILSYCALRRHRLPWLSRTAQKQGRHRPNRKIA